jgi:4-alpha-glucanotransferase
VGDLGPASIAFLDWAASAGQSLWQVLPLGPTGHGNSPYACLSSFAGNPLLISPQLLLAEGFAEPSDLRDIPRFPTQHVAFEDVVAWKDGLLRRCSERFFRHAEPGRLEELDSFALHPDQVPWIEDWALYCALKSLLGGKAWTEWPKPLRLRQPGALSEARRELAGEICHHKFLQFVFSLQWGRLRREANSRGILILGDIPIYAALDSADVWANAHLFYLDARGRPEEVAGVPPDYFSPTGQLWGNPLYHWDRMEREGFSWWIERIRANLRLVDILRLDHFRGFVDYWGIPATEQSAANGRWMTGPGAPFFEAVRMALGSLPLVAEDLGLITPAVTDLRRALGLPGMRVLQFAFTGEETNDNLPHRHEDLAIVYTGTHDNDTTLGWWTSSGAGDSTRSREDVEREHDHCRRYLGMKDDREVHWAMIRAALASVADTAIVPMQDVLGLGSEARMNVPAVADGNWSWRLSWEAVTAERAAWLRELALTYGRLPAA